MSGKPDSTRKFDIFTFHISQGERLQWRMQGFLLGAACSRSGANPIFCQILLR